MTDEVRARHVRDEALDVVGRLRRSLLTGHLTVVCRLHNVYDDEDSPVELKRRLGAVGEVQLCADSFNGWWPSFIRVSSGYPADWLSRRRMSEMVASSRLCCACQHSLIHVSFYAQPCNLRYPSIIIASSPDTDRFRSRKGHDYMKLATVHLTNIGRFRDSTSLDTVGGVTCIVGPNESGKSTLLQSLLMLNDEHPWISSFETHESEKSPSISADFYLEADDREALQALDPSKSIIWWRYSRSRDNQSADIFPSLKRNLDHRHAFGTTLIVFHKSDNLSRFQGARGLDVQDEYNKTVSSLMSQEETLEDSQMRVIRTFSEMILDDFVRTDHSISDELMKLLSTLRNFVEEPHPNELAKQILIDSKPRFVMFSENDRSLSTSYTLSEVAVQTPTALRNLSTIAELDLRELSIAVDQENSSKRHRIIRNSNTRLEEVFSHSWRQNPFCPLIDFQNGQLKIHIRTIEQNLTSVEERSDGLRSYITLRSFLEANSSQSRVILLIDEAELHLHYDAQADLIDLFYNQESASTVIYSTHSMGCLPRDLGLSLRVVSPLDGTDYSTIEPSIWSTGVSGVTTLRKGMGAGLVAMLPARAILVVEGDCDAMLYPTLLRQTLEKRDLSFKIVPGLSSMTPVIYKQMSQDSAKIAFLLDGDEPGQVYRKLLIESNFQEDSIFSLSGLGVVPLVLEDLVDVDLYLDASNAVLNLTDNPNNARITVDLLDGPDRPGRIAIWSKEQGISEPQKQRVIQTILDRHTECQRKGDNQPIIGENFREGFTALAQKIAKFLE